MLLDGPGRFLVAEAAVMKPGATKLTWWTEVEQFFK